MWNIAKSMIHLNLYLFVLVQMTHLLLNEKVYSIYGDKSSKFRFKWIKENETAPELPSVDSAENQSTNFDPSTFLETIKTFVTNPINIARLKTIVRNTGIVTGVGVVGLGGYSFSLYKNYVDRSGGFKTGGKPGDECNLGDLTRYYECQKTELKTSGENVSEKVGKPYPQKIRRNGNKEPITVYITAIKNSENKYIDEDGRTIYLGGDEADVIRNQISIDPYAGMSHNFAVTLNKQTGARIIACPDSDVHTAIGTNLAHGLETIAIVGTGTIGDTNEKKLDEFLNPENGIKRDRDIWITKYKTDKLRLGGIQYKSPAGEVFVRFPDNNKTLFTNLQTSNKKKNNINIIMNPELRNAGFVTYKDGTTKFLDFLGKDSTKSVLKKGKSIGSQNKDDYELVSTTDIADKKIMNDRLNSLRADPEVQSFSVTSWAARQKNGVAKNKKAQSRTIYAFDKTTNELLGVLLTANISFFEIEQNVEKAFGTNAESLVLDGDFYTGLLDLRNMTKEMVGGDIANRNTNMYFTNSAMCLVVPSVNPKDNRMTDEMKKVAFIRAQDDLLKDKLSDPWKEFFGWWNQLIGQK